MRSMISLICSAVYFGKFIADITIGHRIRLQQLPMPHRRGCRDRQRTFALIKQTLPFLVGFGVRGRKNRLLNVLPELIRFRHGTPSVCPDTSRCQPAVLGRGRLIKIAHLGRSAPSRPAARSAGNSRHQKSPAAIRLPTEPLAPSQLYLQTRAYHTHCDHTAKLAPPPRAIAKACSVVGGAFVPVLEKLISL